MDTLKNKKSKTGMKKKRHSDSEISQRDYPNPQNLKTVKKEVEKILWDIVYKIVDRKFEIEMNAKIIDIGMKSLVESISAIIDLYSFPLLSIEKEENNDMWVKDEPAEPTAMDAIQLDRSIGM